MIQIEKVTDFVKGKEYKTPNMSGFIFSHSVGDKIYFNSDRDIDFLREEDKTIGFFFFEDYWREVSSELGTDKNN